MRVTVEDADATSLSVFPVPSEVTLQSVVTQGEADGIFQRFTLSLPRRRIQTHRLLYDEVGVGQATQVAHFGQASAAAAAGSPAESTSDPAKTPSATTSAGSFTIPSLYAHHLRPRIHVSRFGLDLR